MGDSPRPLRACFLAPPDEIGVAAAFLRRAVQAHNAKDRQAAAAALVRADMPSIGAWTQQVLGKCDPAIHDFRPVANPLPFLPPGQRIGKRMPTAAEKAALVARDGFHCRFCGIPVVPVSIRRRLSALYPEAARWGRTNASRHTALLAMWMQLDHLLPHARGGDNSLGNMAITCAPCNFGRMSYTLEEAGLLNPLSREPKRSDWNGLTDLRG